MKRRHIISAIWTMIVTSFVLAASEAPTTNIHIGPVTNNVVVKWLWATQYQFQAVGPVHGRLLGDTNTWVDAAQTAHVEALPDPYYAFDRWVGATTSLDNPLAMVVNEPCAVTALYSVLTTDRGIPLTWLDGRHRLGTNSAAENMDHDGDGHTTLQEWWADTIPTNRESVLAVTGLRFSNDTVTVEWKGGVLSTQYLEFSGGAAAPGAAWRTIFTNQPPTPVSAGFQHHGVTNRLLFYRIGVER